MSNTELTQSQKIARLNDQFRQNLAYFALLGQVVTTASIATLQQNEKMQIFDKVRTFNSFSEDNDPYGKHDFGSFNHNADTIFWKIDYYDKSMEYGSDDPADNSKTKRLLTIMYSHEY